ncbi:MAG: type II toxin-antitoxin system RelE/ParE family toxin [Bradyrhizobium sp.]|nr:type II toxin-antitoxin system RelE/ParE family toxin [Bradyrhizobium sp.]
MPNHKKVIPFPQSQFWKFFDWVDGESNPIEEWLDGESDEVRMTFNSTLKDASKRRDHLEWSCYRHKMEGPEGIHELGFKADRRQYRLLVKFDGVQQVVILCGCYHKMGRWTPANAPTTAVVRAKALSSGKATRHERQIQVDL